jgi:hypothetical protein
LDILRSRFFVALVALLVWGGYAGCVLGACDGGWEKREVAASHSAVAGEDGCDCLCHQVFTNECAVSPVLEAPAVRISLVVELPDFAPDGVPAAIDHPPQLA